MIPLVTIRIEGWVVPAIRSERLDLLAAICPLVAIRCILSIRTEALIIVAIRNSKRPASLPRKRNRLATTLMTASLAALTVLSAVGCTRRYYRKQADQDVTSLIQS